MAKKEKPYLFRTIRVKKRMYNPNYGDRRLCQCGHPYHRHFDWYEPAKDKPVPVGCKYCECFVFMEPKDEKSM